MKVKFLFQHIQLLAAMEFPIKILGVLRIHVSGLIVSQYIDTPSHFQGKMTLREWLKKKKCPG